jgi:phosphoribosyl 1,2-cyclic phosphate phosphodiesterase
MKESSARLTFLGTGTSQGVPIIGCKCNVCRSSDERDKRFRASVFVEYGGLNILVDAGPDFRMQMLRHDIDHLDAILLTHNHKDHTGGLDDVRSLNYVDRRAAEIYCEKNVLEDLIREYPYVFKFPKYPGAPEWMLHVIDERPFIIRKDSADKELVWVHDVGYHYRLHDGSLIPTARSLNDMIDEAPKAVAASDSERSDAGSLRGTPFSPPRGRRGVDSVPVSGGTIVTPIRGLHDKLPVLGFRFGDIAYITDMSSIPESEFEKFKGLKHLTLNTVSYNRHHSHFSLEETLELADRIQAEHTWLTHLSHSFPVHEEFCQELNRLCSEKNVRSIVQPAYDGLVIE